MALCLIQGGGSSESTSARAYSITYRSGSGLRRFYCIASSTVDAFIIAKEALGASTLAVGFKASRRSSSAST
jgi:hypothetical protein